LDDSQLDFTGRVEDLCHPRFAVDAQAFLPLRALGKAVPLPEAQGHLWTQVTVSGRVPDLRLSGEVVGKGVVVGQFHPGDFTLRPGVAGQEVTISELSIRVGQGSVKASGDLKLTPGLPLRARAELEGVSLFRVFERVGLTGAWVDLLATGTVSVTGKL